jgi:hypothetical protein
MPSVDRPLKVFLCHAHADRDPVRGLYTRLTQDGVDAWLDKAKLLPGQDWELEIRKAVREADVVVVCLSKQFNQAGFRQKEVRLALDEADKKPEGEIFIIPARLEECDPPESLARWHWVDLFESDGYERFLRPLQKLRVEKNLSYRSDQKDEYLEKTVNEWLVYLYLEWLNKLEPAHLRASTLIMIQRMKRASDNSSEEAWNLLERLKRLTSLFGGDIGTYSKETSQTLIECAFVAYKLGDLQEAVHILIEANSASADLHDKAVIRWMIGFIYWGTIDPVSAITSWEIGLKEFEEVASRAGINSQLEIWYLQKIGQMKRIILTAIERDVILLTSE